MKDFNQKDVANAFVERVNQSGFTSVKCNHELYSTLVTLTTKSGGKKEYIYFDLTYSNDVQMRRQLPCDGYSCFQSKKQNLKDMLDDFITQYRKEIRKNMKQAQKKVNFFKTLSESV